MVCPSLVQVRSEIIMVCLFIGGLTTQFAAGLRCGSTPPNEHMVRWVLKVTISIKFGAKECSHPCGGPTSTTKPGLVPWQQAARLLAQGATLPTTTCVLGPPNGQQRMGWRAMQHCMVPLEQRVTALATHKHTRSVCEHAHLGMVRGTNTMVVRSI